MIAKSPPNEGGFSIPKTIEVISAVVSNTPMKIAEPSSSDVESPSSVNAPRLSVPEKASMVAVKGPAPSNWICAGSADRRCKCNPERRKTKLIIIDQVVTNREIAGP